MPFGFSSLVQEIMSFVTHYITRFILSSWYMSAKFEEDSQSNLFSCLKCDANTDAHTHTDETTAALLY